jgi:taurine dioxygenase
MTTDLRVERLAAACGGVVHGVDLADLDDLGFEAIHCALLEHQVLFFPGQDLDPYAHKSFAERFGPLEIHPHAAGVSEDLPEVCLLHSEQGGRADVWHTDVTYTPSPPVAAIVRYVEGPAVGGDTAWSNMTLAYEQLSDPLRELLDGLTALHVSTLDDDLCSEHPAVRVHPETGRRSLYVNRLFTRSLRQLRADESRALLDYLHGFSERLELSCRWRWSPGDVVMWDNRCTQHYAINDYDEERTLHRCIVLGEHGVRGNEPRWGLPPARKASSSVGYDARDGEPVKRRGARQSEEN